MDAQVDQLLISGGKRFCRPQNLLEYQTLSRIYLEQLRELHPIFLKLTAVGTRDVEVVPRDLTKLDELIARHAYDPKLVQRYSNLLPGGGLRPESLCRIGFSLSYCSHLPGDPRLLQPIEHGGISFTLRGCAATTEPSADVVMKLPSNERGALHSPKMVRRLLAMMLETWGCTYGRVRSYRYEQTIREGEVASYAGQWLFYLPFPDLGKCLPPDIHTEPFGQGVLIETTPHMPDANNPADVAAGKRVRDVLDEFGLVWNATYAIHGWPPDPEEWRYEEFISGAPSDRKYVVHCVNFDGYDSNRNVLLYAKLFRPLRRQPKQWGLRGWDGPVLNEARRQVRAAAKAGGVPIEWHIGLEESALRVRQLLADFSDITDSQLKVIHTPLRDALQSRSPD